MAQTTSATTLAHQANVLGSLVIDMLREDHFIYTYFKNASVIGGTDEYKNQGNVLDIAIKQRLTAVDRVEGTPLTPTTYTGGKVQLVLDHAKAVPLDLTMQALQKSKFDLVAMTKDSAMEALRDAFETEFLKDIATDAGIAAGNKLTKAAADFGTVAFFNEINKRMFKSRAPKGVRKVVILDPDDYEVAMNNVDLVGWEKTGSKEDAELNGEFILPRLGFYIRRSNFLYTNTVSTKKVRIAMTEDSACMASAMPGELFTSVSEDIVDPQGNFNFRISAQGSVFGGSNQMAIDTLFGSKVYRPENVFLIEDV